MLKHILFILILSTVIAFNIQKKLENNIFIKSDLHKLEAISWPFTICGSEAKWTAQKVLINRAPAKGTQL
jgi:hypothetical protein